MAFKRSLISLSYFLIFANASELLNNKCDFSRGHQILTCIDLNPKTSSDLGNFIKPGTNLLIIKGTSHVEIPANYHNSQNFQHINSYQLVNNGIIEINGFGFNELENLQYLKISDNQQWEVLQANTFYGLHGLETLNIVNNSIKRLKNDGFQGLSNLYILEMMYNNLKVVPSSIFKSLQNLAEMFLSHNNIEILENKCFDRLIELERLDLAHNKIKDINASIFNNLIKLRYLYLSYNEIETIEGGFILPNLQFLYLQNNKLKHILNNLFKSVDNNIKAIDLSYNQINFIDDNVFYNLKSLLHLNLGHNNASSFVNIKFIDQSKLLVVI